MTEPEWKAAELPAAYRSWRSSELGRITDRIEHDLVRSLIGPVAGRRVLDVGCGDGSLAAILAAAGANVTGLDADPRMLVAAQDRAATAGLTMHLVHGDARSLPFADATFDAVTAITVLCFLDAPQRAISEMVRVLRPGGRLVIGELGRHSIWAARRRMSGWLGSTRWRLARFWSPRELCGIAESAGMRVVVVRGAVYYPPCDLCARLLGPIDARLAALSRFGAAFIAVAADRPMNGTPNAKCPRATCRRS